jgi:colanic acid/amylovoran biosynthesis glycosyltransferase
MSDSRLLLVLPLRIFQVGVRFFTDTQACNGLRLWLDNFDYVTLAGPCEVLTTAPNSTSAIDTITHANRITVVPLPLAYRPDQFLKALPTTVRRLRPLILDADYLQFAIGGLWGDWAAVGCLIAQRLRLPHAVWTDRVESRVAEFYSQTKRGSRWLYTVATAKLMARYERFLIRHATIGLFHGMDCYEAYAKYCNKPYVVHDVHLAKEHQISDRELKARLRRPPGPLQLVYAGRAHLEKGVFDWIEALSLAARAGVNFTATWYGAGPELEAARACISQLGLAAKIAFPGPVDRFEVLHAMRHSDAFVFCHKTPESPRCLIEALMCGLPIIGYDSSFPKDLTRNGGGLLTSPNSPDGIARSIAAIEDAYTLHELSRCAMLAGQEFSDEKVFLHRSILMKTIPCRSNAAA